MPEHRPAERKGLVVVTTNWDDPGSGPGASPDDVPRNVERRPGQALPSDEDPKWTYNRLVDEHADRFPSGADLGLPDAQEYLDLVQTTDTAKRWPELRSAQDVAAEQ